MAAQLTVPLCIHWRNQGESDRNVAGQVDPRAESGQYFFCKLLLGWVGSDGNLIWKFVFVRWANLWAYHRRSQGVQWVHLLPRGDL